MKVHLAQVIIPWQHFLSRKNMTCHDNPMFVCLRKWLFQIFFLEKWLFFFFGCEALPTYLTKVTKIVSQWFLFCLPNSFLYVTHPSSLKGSVFFVALPNSAKYSRIIDFFKRFRLFYVALPNHDNTSFRGKIWHAMTIPCSFVWRSGSSISFGCEALPTYLTKVAKTVFL